jgi:hypothetical protein
MNSAAYRELHRRTAVTVVRDRINLAALARQCADMVPHAIEPGPSEAFRFVLVWIERSVHRELGALFPFHGPALYKGLPVVALTSYRRAQPLIRRGCARTCLEALFDWFSRDGEGACLMQLRDVPCEGEIYAALGDIARDRDHMVLATEPVLRDGKASQTLLVGEGAWGELALSGLPLLRWAKRSVAGLAHKTHVGTRRRGIFNHL